MGHEFKVQQYMAQLEHILFSLSQQQMLQTKRAFYIDHTQNSFFTQIT